MTSMDPFKKSFQDTLMERGVPRVRWNGYKRMLDELTSFLEGVAPSAWRLVDLERFYRLRKPNLTAEEIRTYGTALGLVSEVLVACEKDSKRREEEELNTSSQLALGETQTSFTASLRPTTGSSIPPANMLVRQDSALDDGFEEAQRGSGSSTQQGIDDGLNAKQRRPPAGVSTSPAKFVADDFLGENQKLWTANRLPPVKKRTGTLKASEFSRPVTGLSDRPATGQKRRPLSDGSRSDSAKEGGNGSHAIDVTFDKINNVMLLAWRGHVTGKALRNAFTDAFEWARRRGSDRWLVDMRDARVMTPEDSDWFADWLAESGRRGVRLFAIVTPTHAITKMQMGRLHALADASTIAFLDVHRVRTAFFDSEPEARVWLTRAD